MLTLADAIEALTGQRIAQAEQPLSSVVVDSRLVTPGGMFVALRGERQDGHDFVADAFGRGAVAAIVERGLPVECQVLDTRRQPFEWPVAGVSLPLCLLVEDSLAALQRFAAFWRAKFDVRVIGVTGSVGKTMTKEMTYAVLKRRFRTLKSEGNYNNEIGLPLTLLQLTPDHERVVVEMGMYDIGEIALLAEIARRSPARSWAWSPTWGRCTWSGWALSSASPRRRLSWCKPCLRTGWRSSTAMIPTYDLWPS